MIAQRLPEDDKDKQENEFQALFSLFKPLVTAIRNGDNQWETLEDLMYERAEIGVKHALDGFGISFDDAIELMRNATNLTDKQREQRDIIIAAVDNIVDFSVAEEYQMVDEFPEIEDIEDEELAEELMDELETIFTKYNNVYATTENLDIEYAMIVAAALCRYGNDTVLMYMTMGDNRVRPWHRQYEGFTAPKSSFPAWLIPPIEHRCRCFLVEDTVSAFGRINARVDETPTPPEWFNPTFKESVALKGRIFSDEHPYFQIEAQHKDKLLEIAQRIKSKFIYGSNTD